MVEKKEAGVISSVDATDLEFATAEKQRARSFLRERFLRVVTGIIGKKFRFLLVYHVYYLVTSIEIAKDSSLFPPFSLIAPEITSDVYISRSNCSYLCISLQNRLNMAPIESLVAMHQWRI